MAHAIAIFYSWQSDLPNSTNRGFIEDAVGRAAASSRAQPADASTAVEFLANVDRDTRGRLGAPDIAATIFDKIRASDIFVCDVSIINSRSFVDRVLGRVPQLWGGEQMSPTRHRP